jgi:hypothetical protein
MAVRQKDYTEEDFFRHLEESNTVDENLHQHATCPKCHRNYNLVHNDCGEYIDMCSCSPEDFDPTYHCGHCLITFNNQKDWLIDTEYLTDVQTTYHDSLFDDDKYDFDPAFGDVKGLGGAINYIKCNHKHHEVELEDGTKIYCSSVYEDSPIDPDFGLYADSIWNPTWRNEFIAWPDGSVPKNRPLALRQIREAFQLAQSGKMVEIGCIGGHGRTGTILALMYLLSSGGSKTSEQAIEFVRTKYCRHAIEVEIQEWYIQYGANVWYDEELGPEPFEQKDYCSIAEHFAMIIRGHKVCADKGPACPHYAEDIETFAAASDKNHDKMVQLALPLLSSYDLMYGGFVLPDDSVDWACTALDHFAMIAKGHDRCIRIGPDCNLWEADKKEFLERGSMNGIDLTNVKLDQESQLIYDMYPTAEELAESRNQ